MKKAFILVRSFLYIDNETCQPVNNLTDEQKLMDSIFGGQKYTFVEVVEKVGEVSARTLKGIHLQVEKFCTEKGNWDVELYIASRK